MRILLAILMIISFACQAQVNVTAKSTRIYNSDSTHSELDGTEYRNSAGKFRYKQNGVWYYRASTADIASNATLAANGLTKTVNTIRLGGTLTQITSITGAFSLSLAPSTLNLSPTGALSLSGSSADITIVGGDFTMNIGDDISILSDAFVTSTTSASINTSAAINLGSGTDINLSADGDVKLVQSPTNNNALTQILGRNSSTGSVEYRDASSITPTLTSTQVGYGSAGNTLTGEAAFTYTAASNLLQVNAGTINSLGPNNGTALLVEDDAGSDIIRAYESAGTTSLDLTGTGNGTISFSGDVSVAGGALFLAGLAGININNPTDNNALTSLLGRNSSTGIIEERTVASLTTAPSGSDTQVQFNNAGAFGGESTFVYDPAINSLSISNGSGTVNRTIGDSSLGGLEITSGTRETEYNINGLFSNSPGVSAGGLYTFTINNGAVTAGFSFSNGGGSALIFRLSGLPTSSAGLSSGDVYSNAGVLTIVP